MVLQISQENGNETQNSVPIDNTNITSLFKQHLDGICMMKHEQTDQYPSDCTNLLNSMINITEYLNLSTNQIHSLAERINYLSTSLMHGQNEPFFYVHIPKTGGTAFANWLSHQSGRKGRHFWGTGKLRDHMFSRYTATKNRFKTIPKLLMGHMPFGFDVLFLNESQINKISSNKEIWEPQINFTYITVMREPTHRVISQYYYQSKGDNPRKWFTKKRSLYDWIGFFEESKNGAVQFISGCHNAAWYNRKYVQLRENKLEPWPERKKTDHSDIYKNIHITMDQFHIAINHLLKMGWIGLTEKLNESADQLKLFWNITTTKKVLNKKVNRAKPKSVDKNVMDKIKEFNQYDIKLYDLGYVLFLQQQIVVKYRQKL